MRVILNMHVHAHLHTRRGVSQETKEEVESFLIGGFFSRCLSVLPKDCH